MSDIVRTLRRQAGALMEQGNAHPSATMVLAADRITAPTARLERGFFSTVAAVCDVLGEAHALAQMTRADLERLVALGELAQERLAERD